MYEHVIYMYMKVREHVHSMYIQVQSMYMDIKNMYVE